MSRDLIHIQLCAQPRPVIGQVDIAIAHIGVVGQQPFLPILMVYYRYAKDYSIETHPLDHASRRLR